MTTDKHPAQALLEDVQAFHRASGQRIGQQTSPSWAPVEVLALRLNLILEEHVELAVAVSELDFVEVADALVGLLYVVIGTMVVLGLPAGPCWAEVHASNMAKFPPGRPPKLRADGKVEKPEGWEPPDLARILLDAVTETPSEPPLTPEDERRIREVGAQHLRDLAGGREEVVAMLQARLHKARNEVAKRTASLELEAHIESVRADEVTLDAAQQIRQLGEEKREALDALEQLAVRTLPSLTWERAQVERARGGLPSFVRMLLREADR
jgi:predicted HAD superfamily Cof-like phosphohydrolase